MAEIVGLIASIAALAGVAKTAVRFVKEVKSIARDLKTVRDELGVSVDQIDYTARGIHIAQKILRRYCEDRGTAERSEVIGFIRSRRATRYLKNQSDSIQDQIQRLGVEISNLLRWRLTMVVTWKWRSSLRNAIEVLQNRLHLIESHLSLLLNSVLVEIALNREDKDEMEIDRLKSYLKKDERVVRELGKNPRVFGFEPDLETLGISADSLEWKKDIKLVLELARAIRETGTVPTHLSAESPRTSTATTSSRTKSSTVEHSVQDPDDQIRGTAPPEADEPGQESQASELTPPETSSKPPSAVENRTTRQPSSEAGPSQALAVVPRSTPSSHSERRSRAGSERSSGIDEERLSHVNGESDFIDVRPTNNVFEMKRSQYPRRIQGSIERGDKVMQDVTALLEPEQDFNYMTVAQAGELGLLSSIDQYTGEDDQDETWIESYSGRRIKPTGTIQVPWKAPQSRRTSLFFWVFPYHGKRNLVLGDPFVRKTKRLAL